MWSKKARKDFEVALKVDGWRSEYASVQKLLDYLKRKTRSETSRVKYLQELHRFLKHAKVANPDDLVRRSKKEVEGLLQDFVDALAEKGCSIRYINTLIADLKLFFKVNGFKKEREVEVERYFQPARYRKKPEYIPTKEEIFAMADSCGSSLSGLRDKAIILCIYGSGLRNSTLRALRYRDVKKELEDGLEIVKVPVYPEMKEVVPGACKGNIPYFTFFPAEAVKALKKYLAERRRIYGDIPDEAPLFHSEDTKIPRELRNMTFLTKDSLTKIIKKAARIAGIENWRDIYPHCIRKASESFFRGNTTTGIPLDVKTQEFLMGHVLPGSQDAYFDKTKVEELRKAYSTLVFREEKQAAELTTLRTLVESGVLDLSKPNVRQYLIQKLGIRDMEVRVAKMRESGLDEESAHTKIICEQLGIEPMEIEAFKPKENSDPKKIIGEDQLEHYLAEGWDVQTVLPSGRILIRKQV
jgi:integrase